MCYFADAVAGPLVIRGSSMTTLAVFAHLLSVANGNSVAMVNGKPYSVAIDGMFLGKIAIDR
jgi:hypothetical protein